VHLTWLSPRRWCWSRRTASGRALGRTTKPSVGDDTLRGIASHV